MRNRTIRPFFVAAAGSTAMVSAFSAHYALGGGGNCKRVVITKCAGDQDCGCVSEDEDTPVNVIGMSANSCLGGQTTGSNDCGPNDSGQKEPCSSSGKCVVGTEECDDIPGRFHTTAPTFFTTNYQLTKTPQAGACQ